MSGDYTDRPLSSSSYSAQLVEVLYSYSTVRRPQSSRWHHEAQATEPRTRQGHGHACVPASRRESDSYLRAWCCIHACWAALLTSSPLRALHPCLLGKALLPSSSVELSSMFCQFQTFSATIEHVESYDVKRFGFCVAVESEAHVLRCETSRRDK